MKIDDKPMMSDQEIKYIDDLLVKLRPKRCLEWGSGRSTTWFSRHDFIKNWLSIEHNGHYVDYLADTAPPKVQTLWILEGESYADCVQRSNNKFDFILIDGYDRAKCLDNAVNILAKGGVILLHDAGRAEYRDMISKHNGKVVIDGEIPQKIGYAHRGLAVFK